MSDFPLVNVGDIAAGEGFVYENPITADDITSDDAVVLPVAAAGDSVLLPLCTSTQIDFSVHPLDTMMQGIYDDSVTLTIIHYAGPQS